MFTCLALQLFFITVWHKIVTSKQLHTTAKPNRWTWALKGELSYTNLIFQMTIRAVHIIYISIWLNFDYYLSNPNSSIRLCKCFSLHSPPAFHPISPPPPSTFYSSPFPPRTTLVVVLLEWRYGVSNCDKNKEKKKSWTYRSRKYPYP